MNLPAEFGLYLITGFLAQMIGSMLGMGYGMVSSGVLLTVGVPPALASASANTASFVTTTAASWFHHRAGNVDKKTFLCLAVPGIIGSIIGATVVSHAPTDILRPIIAAYLLVISFSVLRKSIKQFSTAQIPTWHLFPLGLVGGALGSIVGGGWGPLVNSHLVANGECPKRTIGSSNAAKSLATFAAAATLIITLKTVNIAAVSGLIIGGLLSAPLAAYSCKRLPARTLMVSMAVLMAVISAKSLLDFSLSAGAIPCIALLSLAKR